MRKFMLMVLALVVVLSVNILPAYADRVGNGGEGRRVLHGERIVHRGGNVRVGVLVGPGWWWPGWWEPYPYYPYYPSPPVIVEQPSELYVQPNPREEAPVYWYFCKDPQGYYPYVNKCPKGWMKVVPPANPPE